MLELTVEDKEELMIPSLYWVSQMANALGMMSRDEDWAHKGEEVTYGEKIEQQFGVLALIRMRTIKEMTGVELLDSCDGWFHALYLDEASGVILSSELEDVMFHTGEIFRALETVSTLLVQLGLGDGIEERLNKLCAEYVGTTLK